MKFFSTTNAFRCWTGREVVAEAVVAAVAAPLAVAEAADSVAVEAVDSAAARVLPMRPQREHKLAVAGSAAAGSAVVVRADWELWAPWPVVVP